MESVVVPHEPPDAYVQRRGEIAALAAGADRPPVDIDYTDAEHRTWTTVTDVLATAWERYGCAEVVAARHRLGLRRDQVPQLSEVSARLGAISGYEYRAVPGLVPKQEFFAALGDGVFLSTQYVRWEGSPLYTPEPDVIHELVGHANLLAHPDLAELHRLAGRAMVRLGQERSRQFVADVFWFSVEFGVVREPSDDGTSDGTNSGASASRGERGWRAYGAGLLSSHGELGWFADHAEVRPLDIAQMGTLPYDIDHYQPVLFGADSLTEVVDVIGSFFADVTDADVDRLVSEPR